MALLGSPNNFSVMFAWDSLNTYSAILSQLRGLQFVLAPPPSLKPTHVAAIPGRLLSESMKKLLGIGSMYGNAF